MEFGPNPAPERGAGGLLPPLLNFLILPYYHYTPVLLPPPLGNSPHLVARELRSPEGWGSGGQQEGRVYLVFVPQNWGFRNLPHSLMEKTLDGF